MAVEFKYECDIVCTTCNSIIDYFRTPDRENISGMGGAMCINEGRRVHKELTGCRCEDVERGPWREIDVESKEAFEAAFKDDPNFQSESQNTKSWAYKAFCLGRVEILKQLADEERRKRELLRTLERLTEQYDELRKSGGRPG